MSTNDRTRHGLREADYDDDAEFTPGWLNGISPGKSTLTSRINPAQQTNIVFRVPDASTARAMSQSVAAPERAGAAEQRQAAEPAAEAKLALAAQSSGAPLPAALQATFEQSVGTSLDDVRVHTGSSSASAAAAVQANAYAVGKHIHFASGKYQPETHAGQRLLAHEVAHTVQQGSGPGFRQNKLEVSGPGDRAELEADNAADHMMAGRSVNLAMYGVGEVVHREGNAHTGGYAPPKPTDMSPMSFDTISERAGPRTPSPVSIQVSDPAPLPKGVSKDPMNLGPPDKCAPGHHQSPPDANPFGPKEVSYPFHVFEQRSQAWAEYGGAAGAVAATYNAAVAPINMFNDSENNPALSQVHEMKLDPSQSGGGMGDTANRQVVPRTNASGTTVGELFYHEKQGDQVVSTGMEADRTGLDDNIKRASKSQAVEAAITNLKAKDFALEGATKAWHKEQKLLDAAGHDLAASDFAVAEVDAQEDKEKAAAELAALNAKAAQIKGAVKGIMAVAKAAASMYAAPGAAAAGGVMELYNDGMRPFIATGTYTPNQGAKNPGAGGAQKVADIAGSSVVSMMAEKIVDYYYGADIAAKGKLLKAATTDYRRARRGKVSETWLASADRLEGFTAGVQGKVAEMKAALLERKNAYLALADAAASAGGGTRAEQDKMKALIMAIPVVKAVVSNASNVMNFVGVHVVNSPAGQIGYGMAVHNSHPSVDKVIKCVGELKGYQTEFSGTYKFWKARLDSLEAIVGDLSGGA